MSDNRNGVLVILTGGNVCLVAAQDPRRNAVTIHRPATIKDFYKYVIGDENERSILLRERTIKGEELKIDTYDLRTDPNRISIDPEELDSSQVDPTLWASIAQVIDNKYLEYEGFVVLHGLDTMAYTASGLSFMLGELQVPVVFTGSQRPLNYLRTDAIQNIRSAISIAGAASLGLGTPVPEVTVCSYDSLFRANRCTMVHASSYRAFDSPNYPTLATLGEHIEIQNDLKRSPSRTKRVVLRKNVNSTVTILDVFPGMNQYIIEHLTKTEGLKGVLLRTYGLGTAPTMKKGILDALEKVVNANIVVMNVSQARGGRISFNQDPVSLRLFEHGVISGVDMTAEAAYAKMVIELSNPSKKEVKTKKEKREIAEDLLQINTCGEQSLSILHFHFKPGCTEKQSDGTYRAILEPLREMEGRHLLINNHDKITYIQLRILGVEPTEITETRVNRVIDFDAHLVSKQQKDNEISITLRKDVLRWFSTGSRTINVAYDITNSIEHLLNPDTVLRIDTIESIKWKKLTIAIYANVSL